LVLSSSQTARYCYLLRITRFIIQKFYTVVILCLCFARISEQTATFIL
jgi:hypothetical protein